MSGELHQEIHAAVDKALGVRLGGLETELKGVRELLERMVAVEERQKFYRDENTALRSDLNTLFDRVRAVEMAQAVNAAKDEGEAKIAKVRIGHTERVLWGALSGGLALLLAGLEFFRKG